MAMPSPISDPVSDNTLSTSQPVMVTTNPATGQVIETYPLPSQEAIAQVIATSHEVWRRWHRVPLAKRAKICRAISQAIKAKADVLAKAVSLETGKPLADAINADVTTAVGVFQYVSQTGPAVLGEKPLPGGKSTWLGRCHTAKRIAHGVTAVISPWNYPLAIAASGIAAALMAGNTIILKPSEYTPAVGQRLVSLIQDVLVQHQLPPEIVQCLFGNGQIGQLLLDGAIDYCVFTGSTRTGQHIQNCLSHRGIRFTMELGGHCPMIALESVSDWDALTSIALWGRLMNAGQSCAAVKRLFVPRAYHDAVVELLAPKISQLVVAGPDNNQAHLGPLISESQRQQVNTLVQEAIATGAQCVIGGHFIDQPGYFYAPTVLTHIPPSARIATEECFGPVLSVYAYDTVNEAIAEANRVDYGLTASVFGNAQSAALVASQLQAGSVGINELPLINYGFPQIPWQGWKLSGNGGSHGEQALLDATKLQVVTTNTAWGVSAFRKPPWVFSRSRQHDLSLAKALLSWLAPTSWWQTLNPAILPKLWQHRSQNKL